MRTSRNMSVTLAFGNAALAAQVFDEAGEFVGKGGSHKTYSGERNL